MATNTLDQNKIDAGKKLIDELDKNPSLDIVSALWYYYTETNDWQLLIYPPHFNDRVKNQQEFYRIIDDCITINSDISPYLQSSDIRLISNSKQNMINMFKSIRETLQTDKVLCKRIGGSIFKGGFYIEDALLYRNAI